VDPVAGIQPEPSPLDAADESAEAEALRRKIAKLTLRLDHMVPDH